MSNWYEKSSFRAQIEVSSNGRNPPLNESWKERLSLGGRTSRVRNRQKLDGDIFLRWDILSLKRQASRYSGSFSQIEVI